MVLAAQKTAQHTTVGGVEVAAAMVRWAYRSPAPQAVEASQLSDQIMATTASPSFKDLEGSTKANPNSSGGVVADGVPFYLSTISGVWYVESASADKVTASIGSAFVVDGALSPNLRSVSTFTLVWSDNGWRIESGEFKRTTQEVFAIGTPFSGGC
ncbi:hypothetical protein QN357_15220 [Cryobacterium sp. RTC2.1]|uniref:hypothetical protein n=1 Tax=Cryobacterium sp. RTC2.1 TaxID=3048634 RepID=UPI002B237EA4|nr:hypothetical protein [Cryobacterium sp. RTC2.1]MEB0004278.1 hypothetical protein [Cryobacterium sp. RTC2.1]